MKIFLKRLRREAWLFSFLFIPLQAHAVSYNSGSFGVAPTDSVLVSSLSVTNQINASTITVNSINTSTATVGLVTISSATVGNMLLTGYFSPQRNAAPRTNVTPAFIGQLIFNTTQNEYCISTGTAVSQWANIGSTTTACKS